MTYIKHYVGIDYSMSCPSITIATDVVDVDSFFESCVFVYPTNNKKHQLKIYRGEECILYGQEMNSEWDSQEERFEHLANWAVQNFRFSGAAAIFIEGYSFGSKGNIFQIGENTGILKNKIYKTDQTFKVVPPTTIKKFATGSGKADKMKMYESFIQEKGYDPRFFLSFSPGKSPYADIVDSYFLAKYCYMKETGRLSEAL